MSFELQIDYCTQQYKRGSFIEMSGWESTLPKAVEASLEAHYRSFGTLLKVHLTR